MDDELVKAGMMRERVAEAIHRNLTTGDTTGWGTVSEEVRTRYLDAADGAMREVTLRLPVPGGWFPFGTHVNYSGPVEFYGECYSDDGLPLWERPTPTHVDSGGDSQPVTVYVCGPMSGLPDFNRPLFNQAAQLLREAGYHVINPAEVPSQGSWAEYMRVGLRAVVTEANLVAVLPGFHQSRGAMLEVAVAEALGVACVPVSTLLHDTGHGLATTSD